MKTNQLPAIPDVIIYDPNATEVCVVSGQVEDLTQRILSDHGLFAQMRNGKYYIQFMATALDGTSLSGTLHRDGENIIETCDGIETVYSPCDDFSALYNWLGY